ncbi:MAG TPA: Wzy polymerase domain-containing protein [Ramlibacter sp.]|nr:Wzy polymerase domain-containing protein [Ramlibacter sp.]
MSRHAGTASLAIGVCLALAWLQPFAPGPSPNVVPWLSSCLLALLAFALARPAWPTRLQLLLLAAAVGFVVLRPATGALDRAGFAGAVVLVVLAYSIARGRGPGGATLVPAIAGAWAGAALVSAAMALLQYFGLADSLHPWVYAASPGEALGNLRQRNQFSCFTTIGLAAVLWLATREDTRWVRWIPAVLLLAVANAASTSRTGLLQWVALLLLVALWRAPNRRGNLALCGIALAMYGLATLLLPWLLELATGTSAATLAARLATDLGCSSRKVLWRNVLELIALRPFAGWGWGELDYAHYVHLYGVDARFCDILDNGHNLPLHLAVELGLPFAVLVTAGAAWWVLRARPWVAPDAQRQLAWAVLMALATHSLVEYPLWYGPFQIALGLALGLLVDALQGAPVRQAPSRLRHAWVAAGFVLVAYTGWDYARVSQVYVPPEQRLSWWADDALEHARKSRLFAGQARFAELTMTPVTRENADVADALGREVLHYSPEPRVVERVIEAATMQGRLDEAVQHLARYRAAFPQDYERWRAEQRAAPGNPAPRTF